MGVDHDISALLSEAMNTHPPGHRKAAALTLVEAMRRTRGGIESLDELAEAAARKYGASPSPIRCAAWHMEFGLR